MKASSDEANDVVISRKCISENSDCILTKDNLQRKHLRNKPSSLVKTNTYTYVPTGDYNPSTKLYTDKTHYENMTGYDATKTQVLKNVNGTLTWQDE